MHPASVASCFLVLILGLNGRNSRSMCDYTLEHLKTIISLSSNNDGSQSSLALILSEIPKDSRTLLRRFKLDPHLRTFICCPLCFALYADTRECPTRCTFKGTPDAPECSARLFRTRSIRGNALERPIRKYSHQEMKHWMARFLSRPDIELTIESYTAEATGRHRVVNDILGSRAILDLRGPDGQSFIRGYDSNELRLVFSLCADGFNPFGNKVAKGGLSVTGIYMVCLNLPPDQRYHIENMYLVGVVPGPNKPSMEELNHFLRPLMDDLLEFWSPGVFFSRTFLHSNGRTARAALIPLVCDILGARQAGGFASHASSLFCSFCLLTSDKIEDTNPNTWCIRDQEMHRRNAKAWRDAETKLERDELFKIHGVRYSELLRLPYWNPVLFTVLDSMHALFLRTIPQLIRYTWGIDASAPCGDGLTSPTTKPPHKPDQQSLLAGVQTLKAGQLNDQHSQILSRLKRPVLWHLCKEFDLRRAGTRIMMARELISWVRDSG
jgi:hypothetical protein